MFDEKFWLAIAFFTFVGLIVKLVGPKIGKALDQKSKIIAEEILQAKQARQEAQDLLEQARKTYQESIETAKNLVKQADEEAQILLQNAKDILSQEVARMTLVASQRVKYEEEIAIREIKNKIITSAIIKLQDKAFDQEGKDKIVENSIKNLQRIH